MRITSLTLYCMCQLRKCSTYLITLYNSAFPVPKYLEILMFFQRLLKGLIVYINKYYIDCSNVCIFCINTFFYINETAL